MTPSTVEAPGQRSRGLELPAAGGGEPAGAGGEGGFRGLTLSNVAALAGMAFSVEQHVPDFELRARELVHPLFEELKVKVRGADLTSCCRVQRRVVCRAGLLAALQYAPAGNAPSLCCVLFCVSAGEGAAA